MLSPSVLGVIVGLALGFAAAFGGFSQFVIVAFIAAIGYAVGKVLEGDLDLSSILGARNDNRR